MTPELAILIAGAALFCALAALWLVGQAMRKIEGQSEEIVRVHISKIREQMNENAKTAKTAEKDARILTEAVKKLEELQTTEAIRLRGEIENIAVQLTRTP